MRTRNPSSTDGRGVSEVISFTLIFSLIAATVALVYLSGIGGLESTRSAERVTNAERAFDVLADNVADIQREGAPSRATEIKVSDAQMEFDDPSRLTVTIENLNGTNADDGNISTVVFDPIVYSAGSGPQLVYANGAIFRQDRGGTVMDNAPPFLFTNDGGERTAILPTIQTRNAGVESTGSERTILVRTLLASREVSLAEDDPETLTNDPDDDGTDESSFNLDPDTGSAGQEYHLSIDFRTAPERQGVWLDYLNGEIPTELDLRDIDGDGTFDDDPPCEAVGTDTVECDLVVENVYSTVTRVDVVYD